MVVTAQSYLIRMRGPLLKTTSFWAVSDFKNDSLVDFMFIGYSLLNCQQTKVFIELNSWQAFGLDMQDLSRSSALPNARSKVNWSPKLNMTYPLLPP